jgi:hypothetical protein
MQFFIHLTLQNSLQKALFLHLQKHQQICFFSFSTERVTLGRVLFLLEIHTLHKKATPTKGVAMQKAY